MKFILGNRFILILLMAMDLKLNLFIRLSCQTLSDAAVIGFPEEIQTLEVKAVSTHGLVILVEKFCENSFQIND